MKKNFALPLMTTVLPGLMASCAEPATQNTQTYTQSVPEGCELEIDGEIDCDDDIKTKKTKKPIAAAGAAIAGSKFVTPKPSSTVQTAKTTSSQARPATPANARAESVSRGGFSSTARASSSSAGS